MSRGVHPLAGLIAAGARGVSGVQVRWVGCKPEVKQRIYFANHTSHLDFVVLWSALPGKARERTRPVAAKDYWNSGIRAYLAQKVFRAALIHRRSASQTASSESSIAEARMLIDQLTDAMGETDSLIIFPEGTRGTGEAITRFRSGIYYLAKRKPEVELVPAYLENLSRILPKGEFLPVPLLSMLTFGTPMLLIENETKGAFLERAQAAIQSLRRKGQP
jgi:1-acyl-sn-glycerol-3-phosphate acyltransferase